MKMKITLIIKIILLVMLIIFVIVGGILAYIKYRSWICSKIPMESVERRALCYCEIIKVRNEADQEAKEAKDICYLYFAESATDLSICEKIYSQFGKDFCYSKISYNKREPSICDKKIQSSEIKDTCYYNLASGMIDFSLCEKIQDERNKEMCKERVEQRLEK